MKEDGACLFRAVGELHTHTQVQIFDSRMEKYLFGSEAGVEKNSSKQDGVNTFKFLLLA